MPPNVSTHRSGVSAERRILPENYPASCRKPLRRFCIRAGFRRRSALALDEFGGQTFRFNALALQQIHHRVHGGHAEPVLWLADGRQRHAKIFRRQDIAETHERNILRNPQTFR